MGRPTLGGDTRRGAATPVLTSWGIPPYRSAGPPSPTPVVWAGAGLRDYANRTLHTAHARDVAAASKLLVRVSVVFIRTFLIIPLGGPHAKALAPGRVPRSLPPRPDRQSRRSSVRAPFFLSRFLTSFPPFGISVGTGLFASRTNQPVTVRRQANRGQQWAFGDPRHRELRSRG